MRSVVARLTPHVLGAWIVVGALVPRLSPLRPLYLINTYALLPTLLGAVVLDRLARTGGWRSLPLKASDVALAAFLLGAVVSIAMQDQPGTLARASLLDLWRTFVVPIAAFWAIRLAPPRQDDLAKWAPPLGALCALEVAVALLAWFDPALLPGCWPGVVHETGGVRITGTLSHHDVYGAVLVFAATFMADVCAATGSRTIRWLAGGTFTVAFTGVFLSFSRASWLGGLLALAILVATYGRQLAAPCVAILCAVAALSGLRGSSQPSPPRPIPTPPEAQHESYAATRLTMAWTVRDRVVLDVAGLKMFIRKPLLGWGFGSYDRHAHAFVASVGRFVATDWDKNEAASHCTHLSVLAEMGIVGYALLAFPFVQLWVAFRRSVRGLPRDRSLTGLWASVAFLAVVSVLIDLRYLPFSLGLGGIVLGLIATRVEGNGHVG